MYSFRKRKQSADRPNNFHLLKADPAPCTNDYSVIFIIIIIVIIILSCVPTRQPGPLVTKFPTHYVSEQWNTNPFNIIIKRTLHFKRPNEKAAGITPPD
jgi:hypothetical protein